MAGLIIIALIPRSNNFDLILLLCFDWTVHLPPQTSWPIMLQISQVSDYVINKTSLVTFILLSNFCLLVQHNVHTFIALHAFCCFLGKRCLFVRNWNDVHCSWQNCNYPVEKAIVAFMGTKVIIGKLDMNK